MSICNKYESAVDSRFLNYVKNHKLTIVHDFGVNRNIHVANPDNKNMWFRIITYNGGLLFTGDMQTFVFERLGDMFEFFDESTIRSVSYCAEKCVAGVKEEFDNDLAQARALEHINSMLEEESWEWDDAEVPYFETEYEYSEWFYNHGCDGCEIPNMRIRPYHFLWCLRAIVWTINQYKALK